MTEMYADTEALHHPERQAADDGAARVAEAAEDGGREAFSPSVAPILCVTKKIGATSIPLRPPRIVL